MKEIGPNTKAGPTKNHDSYGEDLFLGSVSYEAARVAVCLHNTSVGAQIPPSHHLLHNVHNVVAPESLHFILLVLFGAFVVMNTLVGVIYAAYEHTLTETFTFMPFECITNLWDHV